MDAAIAWGALAALSLVLGAVLALARAWSERAVGLVLAFGAGALISAVSFELAEDGIELGGGEAVGIGLATGAAVYFALDRALERWSSGRRSGPGGSTAWIGLALGAVLDGIPEQLVLGIGLASGQAVSLGLLVAIFVSNLPEAIGAASEMQRDGWARRVIVGLWCAVAVVCTIATALGHGVGDELGDDGTAVVSGFAAGALLVMLADSMIPEANRKAGDTAGLVTVLGFAVGAGLAFL